MSRHFQLTREQWTVHIKIIHYLYQPTCRTTCREDRATVKSASPDTTLRSIVLRSLLKEGRCKGRQTTNIWQKNGLVILYIHNMHIVVNDRPKWRTLSVASSTCWPLRLASVDQHDRSSDGCKKSAPRKPAGLLSWLAGATNFNIVFVIIVLAKRKGSRQTTAWLEESDTRIQLRYSLHNEWTHCNDIFLLLNAQAQILYVSKSTLNELVWKVLWSWKWHAPRIVCSYMSLPCCYCQHVVCPV